MSVVMFLRATDFLGQLVSCLDEQPPQTRGAPCPVGCSQEFSSSSTPSIATPFHVHGPPTCITYIYHLGRSSPFYTAQASMASLPSVASNCLLPPFAFPPNTDTSSICIFAMLDCSLLSIQVGPLFQDPPVPAKPQAICSGVNYPAVCDVRGFVTCF